MGEILHRIGHCYEAPSSHPRRQRKGSGDKRTGGTLRIMLPMLVPHNLLQYHPTGIQVREWSPCSRASNCGMPTDNTHFCWHTEFYLDPDRINITGSDCGAGDGSLGETPERPWHGWLKRGYLIFDSGDLWRLAEYQAPDKTL